MNRTRVVDCLLLALGLSLLAGIFLASDFAARALRIPLPGNVVGMAVLFVLLLTKIVPLAWVERAADLLLKNLSLLFVPAAVAVARHRQLLGDSFFALAVLVVVTTMAVLLVTGLLAQWLVRTEPSAPTTENENRE